MNSRTLAENVMAVWMDRVDGNSPSLPFQNTGETPLFQILARHDGRSQKQAMFDSFRDQAVTRL